jgi:cell division protein FtsW
MSTRKKTVDPILLSLVAALVFGGFLVFSSASLGLLARDGATFSSVAFTQFFFGIIGGGIAMFLTSSIHYRHWRKYAFYIFLATCVITTLVFIPALNFSHGGATRWISLGGFTFQPTELLKLGFVIYMATWLSGVYKKLPTFRYGTLPFLGLLAIPGALLLMQPDTDNFLILAAAASAMFVTAGGRWRDIIIMLVLGALLLTVLAFSRDYIMDRLTSFANPSVDPQGSGYQIRQSLIAIGSGGVTGRGFGQSVQKFEYLPEPIGDSIFAVYAEEFGFLGAATLIIVLATFTFRGYRIATEARDLFGMLLVVGFMTLIVVQAFLNIASMVGLAPISGIPLPFVSHGGTALLMTLAAVGIVLNVSKYRRAKR